MPKKRRSEKETRSTPKKERKKCEKAIVSSGERMRNSSIIDYNYSSPLYFLPKLGR